MTTALDLERASGLDRARRRADGTAPLSRVHATFGLRFTEVSDGTATVACALSPWLVDVSGHVAAGIAAVVADSALGTALLTTMPAGRSIMTSQLRIDHLAPITSLSGELHAIAHVEDLASASPLVVAEVRDDTGLRVASASARCMTVTGHGELLAPLPPVGPTIIDPGGAEALAAMRRGEGSPPFELFLHAATTSESGATVLHVPAVPGFANVFGGMQGGALALLAEQAMGAMARAAVRPGGELVPVDLQVTYLRPALTDQQPVSLRAHVVRSGGRVVDTACEVLTGTGVVAVARGSHLRVVA